MYARGHLAGTRSRTGRAEPAGRRHAVAVLDSEESAIRAAGSGFPVGHRRVIIAGFVVALALSGFTAPALRAQAPVRTRRAVTGGPAGVRLQLGYAADAFLPARGGLSREVVALDNLDLLLHLNLDLLFGVKETSVRVHVQSNRGSSVSARVGDLQGVSNIEAPREWRLYEAWIEHNIVARRLSILAGVYDVNAEFDVIPAAGDFLNSSFGFGPEYSLSGESGPSAYPLTSFGARLKARPAPALYALLGVSDGVVAVAERSRFALGDGEGALVSFEAGYTRSVPAVIPVAEEPLSRVRRGRGRGIGRQLRRGRRWRIGRGRIVERVHTKVALGGWAYTRRFQVWDPDESLGRSWGAYLLGERVLYEAPNGTGGVSGFARVGTAADAVNRLDLYMGGGLVYFGALPGRPEDVAGLGIAYARNGSPFLRARRAAGIPMERAETVLEVMYKAQFGELFVLEPNVQWVMNPGMDPGVANALVFGLRGHVLLEFPSRRSGG
jgi:porin